MTGPRCDQCRWWGEPRQPVDYDGNHGAEEGGVMMEFALAMARLGADLEITKRERDAGTGLTSEEKSEIYARHFRQGFDAGLNAGIARDMARVQANMPPPIWIKPAMWGAVTFVVTLAAMVLS